MSVTHLWQRFWFEIRFSFFIEEKYHGKAKTHFPIDGVTTNKAPPSTLRQYLHTLDQEVVYRKNLTFLLWFVVRMAANKECLTFTNLLINNYLFFLRVLILIYRFIACFKFPFHIAHDLYAPPLFKSYSQTSPTLLFLFRGPLRINPSTVQFSSQLQLTWTS